MWDVRRHSSCMNHYQCWPVLQHLQHRVHFRVAVEGLERSSRGCQVVEGGRYPEVGMVNGATISSVSRCRILHTSEGRWLSSSRGHFTTNEHKMGMCSCKMLSCLWLAEFVMQNEPVAMALTICRASSLPAA